MVKLLSDTDAKALEKAVNAMGPHVEIISAYSIHQIHFVWVRMKAAKDLKKGT